MLYKLFNKKEKILNYKSLLYKYILNSKLLNFMNNILFIDNFKLL